MVSIAAIKKYNSQLMEENDRLMEQIECDKRKMEHWKMLSELFLDEINKAKIRYGCDEA